MKVALVNSLYKPYSRGGAEKHTEMLALGLRKLKIDYFVITTKPILPARFKDDSQDEKIYYLPSFFYCLNKIPKFFRIFWHIADIFDIRGLLKVYIILKKEKPDLIIINNQKGLGILSMRAAAMLHIKTVKIIHDIQLLHPSGLMYFGKEDILESQVAQIHIFINRLITRSFDLVISPSQWLLNLHKKYGFFEKSDTKVILNPFDVNFTPRNINCDSSNIVFVVGGQLEPHKGINIALEAFCELQKGRRNIKLKIIGRGSLSEKIKKLKNDSIKYRDDIYSYNDWLSAISSGHCLIVPSSCYENSPMVIYEALAFGIPVIASDIGGINELISESDGFLFMPGNAADLKIKMDLFVERPFKASGYFRKKIESPEEYLQNIIQ